MYRTEENANLTQFRINANGYLVQETFDTTGRRIIATCLTKDLNWERVQ